jgi:hypothetical protein
MGAGATLAHASPGVHEGPQEEGVSVVESKSSAKAAKSRKGRSAVPPIMSMSELAQLGGGKIAYIKVMTADEAKQMFPAVEGIPAGIDLFALHAADGTPLALTDSRQAALGHAMGDELEIASLH